MYATTEKPLSYGHKGVWRAALFALVLAGCGTGTNAFINQVLLTVQQVCHAVIDDSNGAIEKIIAGLPWGTTALGAAQFVCAYIDAAPPLPGGALRATMKGGVARSRCRSRHPVCLELQKNPLIY